MNPALEQVVNIYKAIPLSRKIAIVAAFVLLMAGFGLVFYWGNKIDYQPLYTNLSPEDASQVVEKLQEQRIPYELKGNGAIIMVPAEKVYDLRLAMAGAGLPKGGDVGFELFDKTEFGTTEFVQKLNYQRAMQGELARTIKEFDEVADARVMIVLPKESVFIEESRPPSASVLLKLKSPLSKEKVAAVVHLVANAVEAMEPQNVTVVDSAGKVLAKGNPEEERAGTLASTQLEYKLAYEQKLAGRIQTMLESIVGPGKAIVRVSADMDFDQVNINEEIYDPDGQVVRSRQNQVESSDKKSTPVQNASTVNPTVAGTRKETSDQENRQSETVNYEINRTIRQTVRSVGAVTRLSVAAVLDGSYTVETDADGNKSNKYVERPAEELAQFKTIIQNAMGYNEDREDQVTVESFPFSYMAELNLAESPQSDLLPKLLKEYRRILVNGLLILLVFFLVIRPLVKTVGEVKTAVVKSLPGENQEAEALPGPGAGKELPEPEEQPSPRKIANELATQDINKTASILRGWINEAEK